MKRALFSLSLLVTGALSSNLCGQAIVDATLATPGSVSTISAALAGSASEIIVKNTGVYNEALLITRSVILRGEDPNNRPIIAMQANASQPSLGNGDGIYIGGTASGSGEQTIEFKNFIVIPSQTNPITDDAFSVTANPGGLLNFTMENVLCAPNNGMDQPLATSVWDNPDLAAPGVIRVPDDGMYLMDEQFAGFDGDIKAVLTNVVMIGVGATAGGGDAFVIYPGNNGAGSATLSGLGASHNHRYAMQTDYEVPFIITGTNENPGFVMRKNNVGIIFFTAGDLDVDHMVAVENANVGIRVDADTVVDFDITDSLFANNGFQGIYLPFTSTTPKTWSISNTTFYNNGYANLNTNATTVADLTVNVTDCIFAGPVSPGIWNEGAAVINVDNSALVTEGPDALPVATQGPVNVTDQINSDPAFVSKAVDPLVATSFDVTATAYATASSTGGPLNGWGEGPASNVQDWNLY